MYVRGSRGWWLARPVIISILSIVFVKLCRTPRAMVDRDIRFCNRYAFFPISFAFGRTLSDSLINWKWTGERKPWPCNRRRKDVETVSTDQSQITAAFNASCHVSFHSFFPFLSSSPPLVYSVLSSLLVVFPSSHLVCHDLKHSPEYARNCRGATDHMEPRDERSFRNPTIKSKNAVAVTGRTLAGGGERSVAEKSNVLEMRNGAQRDRIMLRKRLRQRTKASMKRREYLPFRCFKGTTTLYDISSRKPTYDANYILARLLPAPPFYRYYR